MPGLPHTSDTKLVSMLRTRGKRSKRGSEVLLLAETGSGVGPLGPPPSFPSFNYDVKLIVCQVCLLEAGRWVHMFLTPTTDTHASTTGHRPTFSADHTNRLLPYHEPNLVLVSRNSQISHPLFPLLRNRDNEVALMRPAVTIWAPP